MKKNTLLVACSQASEDSKKDSKTQENSRQTGTARLNPTPQQSCKNTGQEPLTSETSPKLNGKKYQESMCLWGDSLVKTSATPAEEKVFVKGREGFMFNNTGIAVKDH